MQAAYHVYPGGNVELTPLLLGPLREQGSHLHQTCCVNMSILAIEISLPDFEAVGAGTVDRQHPLKHRTLVLRGRPAEQRGALPLGAQLGEHDCPETGIGLVLARMLTVLTILIIYSYPKVGLEGLLQDITMLCIVPKATT